MLQERKIKRIGGTKDIDVDVRILIATNEDLRKAVTEGRDADGFPKETITETTVFADVSSTKRSEFYAARQAGISLALTVKLRAADYDGQERLSYEGKEYKVERAYTEAREYYELNCSEFREASE